MSTDPLFKPPVEARTDAGAVAWRRAAKHERGNNAPLRRMKDADLKVMCGTHLFAVVWTADGRTCVTTSQLSPWRSDPHRLGHPLDGAWSRDDTHEGPCPCGRLHTLDLGKLREALDRLRHSPAKRRVVDLPRVLHMTHRD